MVPRTRRRVLHGAVVLLTGLAGCGRTTNGETTATRSVPPERQDTGSVPEHRALRSSSERAPVWFAPENAATASNDATGTDTPERRDDRGFVADAETARRLRFADVDGADEAERFVTETDFRSETVYVESRPARECFTLELCSVDWSETSVHTQYGSYYRDVDVSCRAEASDAVSTLIRIPEALDPSAVRSHGSGWSSNGCRSRRPPDGQEETADAPHFGPKTSANATRTTNATETADANPTDDATPTADATETGTAEDGR